MRGVAGAKCEATLRRHGAHHAERRAVREGEYALSRESLTQS